ncbi:hypothetical protein HZH68_008951 [Vespula germanica]|uniref:Uncharacterized protein n=1 Tax=Vespula germanica TaxID=30212 RepID=A0A834N7H7_VESGE|nr:hypothetical protein HZH68_008951 [Vespula germanica]
MQVEEEEEEEEEDEEEDEEEEEEEEENEEEEEEERKKKGRKKCEMDRARPSYNFMPLLGNPSVPTIRILLDDDDRTTDTLILILPRSLTILISDFSPLSIPIERFTIDSNIDSVLRIDMKSDLL